MSTTTAAKTMIAGPLEPAVLARIAEEGYGPGAWHGPDLKAALADVGSELAFWRPAPGRHNIAEIAVHHAYCTRSAHAQLSGTDPEPFVLDGEDWFELSNPKRLSWAGIQTLVETEHRRFQKAVAASTVDGAGKNGAAALNQQFEIVLGLTCHAIYHAGQVQLIKRLHAG